MLGGVLMLAVGALYLFYEDSIIEQLPSTKRKGAAEKKPLISRVVIGIQVGLVMLAILVTRSSVASIQSKQGLPLGTQLVAWLTMSMWYTAPMIDQRPNIFPVASVTVPALHRLQPSNHYLHRLLVIFLTFSPTFIILTISYEGLFYLAFCITLVTWVRLEHHIYKYTTCSTPAAKATPTPAGQYRALTLADARISLFSLFLLQSAFFSTGNIASISSFSLDAVYRLIPVFDPFSQGALLIVKIIVPFAILSANLGILNRRLGVPPSSLFMIVMAIGDVMTIRFFWMVRDEGSWLDIGTSISHFCISSALCMFVSGLEVASEKFIEGVEFNDDEEVVAALEGVTHDENGDGNGKIS